MTTPSNIDEILDMLTPDRITAKVDGKTVIENQTIVWGKPEAKQAISDIVDVIIGKPREYNNRDLPEVVTQINTENQLLLEQNKRKREAGL